MCGGYFSFFALWISHNDAVSCERWRTANALDRTRVETHPPSPARAPAFCESLAGREVAAEQQLGGGGGRAKAPPKRTQRSDRTRWPSRRNGAIYINGTKGARVCVLLLPSSLTVRGEMARKRPTHPTGSSGRTSDNGRRRRRTLLAFVD